MGAPAALATPVSLRHADDNLPIWSCCSAIEPPGEHRRDVVRELLGLIVLLVQL
eukprot:COSAG04_NODE_300_length_17427_cov_16.169725_4_plen_54_part_00